MIKKRHYLVALIIFAIGAVFGSIFDYQISTALYVKNSGFGIGMAAFGQAPGYLMLSALAAYTLGLMIRFYKKQPLAIVLVVVCVVVMFVSSYFIGNDIVNENGFNMLDKIWVLGLPIGFVITLPGIIIGLLLSKKIQNKNLWLIAFYIMLFLGISIGLVTLIKLIPHRPRFRLLIDNNSIKFHNWWEIFLDYKNYLSSSVTKEEFKSFPSGHISFSICIINFIFLPTLIEKEISYKAKVITFYCALAYVILLGYSRINAGAHFLSDVSISGIIGLTIHFACALLVNKEMTKQSK